MKASTFWGLIGLLILILAAVASIPAKAQDLPQPIVCRDTDYGYGSFVIRTPVEWDNPDLASWWVLADGFGAYADGVPDVYRADALTHVDIYGEGNPQWMQDLKVGDVVVGSGDYEVIVVANQDTAECDANDFPVAPASTPEPDNSTCTAVAVNSANGEAYCYTPQANGVVPLPPAPK